MTENNNTIQGRPVHLDYRDDEKLINYEHLCLRQRNKKLGRQDENYIGLALSGGGIRSASFSLGVMQSLARFGAFRQVDYLSTVSGGGYIGSSLTWFLNKPWSFSKDKTIQFGVDAHNFPFGTAPNAESDEPGAGSREKMSILRHLRQNMNYLFPGKGINPAAFTAALLRGVVFNILVYLPVLVLLLMCLAWLAGLSMKQDPGIYLQMGHLSKYACVALVLFAIVLVGGILYGLYCGLARTSPHILYKLRRGYLKLSGYLLIFSAMFLVIASVPYFYDNLILNKSDWLSSSGITLGGILSGIWTYIRTGSTKKTKPIIPTGLIISITAILLIYGFVLLSYEIAATLVNTGLIKAVFTEKQYIYALCFVIPIIIGFAVNINFITLHRYYRDRLMELFMPVMSKLSIDKIAQPADEANITYVHQMCDYENGAVGPYHIVNANIMLPGSGITKFRGRGGDNFILSPLYCGSDATGWHRSDKYINGKFTFPTAMAISGAAVNPNTGEGATRNPLLSAIMGFLNLRLGVWVENPRLVDTTKWYKPNLWFPGLRDILLSKLMNEKSRFIELSDGGHFENLAMYELIRRKSDLIIVCDGAADPDFTFGDFANLVEKVRLDFGAMIDINLDKLIPKKCKDGPYGLKKIAEAGFAIGTIQYQNKDKPGLLIYIKTTLIRDLPADIYGYKLSHDSFPDEPTSDQFFNEKQFEAYRELGFQLGKRMLRRLATQLQEQYGKEHPEYYEWLLVRLQK